MTSRQLTHQAVTAAATDTHSLIQRRALVVNQPGDRYEREADRVADAVMSSRGPAPFTLSAVPITHVQREDAPKEKTDEEKYKEGAGKLGEAFLETPFGKELVEKVKQDKLVKGATEAGKSFIGTLPGKIITGAAAAGAVATLAATHKELPAQIPEIPLDALTPGLSVEITYKGPVDKPTEAMITFKFTEQAPKGGGEKKPDLTRAEKQRAENVVVAADQAKFRAGMKYPPGSPEDLQQKAEDAAVKSALAKYAPGPDLDAIVKKYPWLGAQPPKGGLQLTPPAPSFGYKPPALLGDEYRLKLPGEQKKKDDEPVLQRQASSEATVDAAPPVVHAALSTSGQPLEAGTRTFMEARFGHDFGQVRVHTDAQAAESARAVNAVAYTVGRDVVFGAGQYAPNARAGQRLLAHELTHVVQQAGSNGILAGSLTPGAISPENSLVQRSERDPDELAAMAKEDEALKERAKRALKGKPDMAVHEVMWRLIKNYGLDTHFELSGSRYDKKQKGVLVVLRSDVKGPRTTGQIVGGDEVLERVAAGQAAQVAREIEVQIGKVNSARGTVDYVFLMGADAPKSGNKFYTEAKKFFKTAYPGAIMVEDVRDLEGINQTINSGNKPVANLYIVSHAHPDGTLQFSLDPSDKTPGQVQYSELKKANENQNLTQPKPDLIGFWTNVLIRGCNLGRNEEMLQETRKAFGGAARVIAPTHEQIYGGGKESLGGAFYEEPGISKLTDDKAFERIKAKPEYAFITDWKAMRTKLKRFVQSIPEIVYDGKFPEKGKELALLRSEQGAKEAAHFTFGSSRVDGADTVFTFKPDDPFKRGEVEIRQETPPDDKTAIERARTTVPRPDAYAYKVRRPRSGLTLSVIVDIQRTEWEIYHAEIKKQGKGFNPSLGSKPWYGDTEY